jgi:hypothetical protein
LQARLLVTASDWENEPTNGDGVLGQIRAIGDPEFPLDRVLLVLAQAADHLENGLGWDGHGWETVRAAVRCAAAYLHDRMPTEADMGCGPPTPEVEAIRAYVDGRRMGAVRGFGDDE